MVEGATPASLFVSARWYDRGVVGACLLAIQVLGYYSALDHYGHTEPRMGLAWFGAAVSLGAALTILVWLGLAVRDRTLHGAPVIGGLTYGASIGTLAGLMQWPIIEAMAMDSEWMRLFVLAVIGEYALIGLPLALFPIIGVFLAKRGNHRPRRMRTAHAFYVAAPAAISVFYLALTVAFAFHAPGSQDEVTAMYEESPALGSLSTVSLTIALIFIGRRRIA